MTQVYAIWNDHRFEQPVLFGLFSTLEKAEAAKANDEWIRERYMTFTGHLDIPPDEAREDLVIDQEEVY